MRQLDTNIEMTGERERPLRIWRRGLHLTPPQLRYMAHARPGGAQGSIWSMVRERLLRRK